MERKAWRLLRILAPKLPRYKNLDVLGSYAIFENIKENDFSKKPASFENKVRNVVAPGFTVTNDPSWGYNGIVTADNIRWCFFR
ncbi:MAG TPA: hypothetical protein VGJ66_22775 [Pyrinomonadaceae bacterium]